jgi:hypothetical protein
VLLVRGEHGGVVWQVRHGPLAARDDRELVTLQRDPTVHCGQCAEQVSQERRVGAGTPPPERRPEVLEPAGPIVQTVQWQAVQVQLDRVVPHVEDLVLAVRILLRRTVVEAQGPPAVAAEPGVDEPPLAVDLDPQREVAHGCAEPLPACAGSRSWSRSPR